MLIKTYRRKMQFKVLVYLLVTCPFLSLHAKDIEVAFYNKKAGIKLSGTLCVPDTLKTYPVAVLITGAGQQDRDETVGDYKLFKIIADHLCAQGIATLRFDDRGAGKSEGLHDKSTTLDFADDVLSAIEYLKQTGLIDTTKIGLIGHSEGGLIAPVCYTKNNSIKYIISLAGPGRVGMDVFQDQIGKYLASKGSDEQSVETYKRIRERVIRIYIDPETTRPLEVAKAYVKTELAKMDSATLKKLPPLPLEETWDKEFVNPWYAFFLTCNPIDYWSRVNCKTLLLYGENDILVSSKNDLPLVYNALQKHHLATQKTFKGTNHFFQTSTEVFDSKAAINKNVLKAMSEWLVQELK